MTDFASLPLMLTVKMFAEITGQHEKSVYRGIEAGRIPADKPNGQWLICRDLVFPNTKEALAK